MEHSGEKKQLNLPLIIGVAVLIVLVIVLMVIGRRNQSGGGKSKLPAVQAIDLAVPKTELALDERMQITANTTPENANKKSISWESSDEAVAAADSEGIVTGTGGGKALITASAGKGVSASLEVQVDASKRALDFSVTRYRDDGNNIGEEWHYTTKINGKEAGKECIVSVGDTLKIDAEYAEKDDNPDIGRASDTHTVTQKDFEEGFTLETELYVTENAGRNKGKQAHFKISYEFARR